MKNLYSEIPNSDGRDITPVEIFPVPSLVRAKIFPVWVVLNLISCVVSCFPVRYKTGWFAIG